jgi:hypothetical protein
MDIDFSDLWLDSLIHDAQSGKIVYKIVYANCSNSKITTKIQLPQTLPLDKVYRQIVLYYSLLRNEEDREKEEVQVYPYFTSLASEPNIVCSYKSGGRYFIHIESWIQIPIPRGPGPEERAIFNQIIQVSIQQIQAFSHISDEVFEEIAHLNNMPTNVVKEIYQNTILWQHAQ